MISILAQERLLGATLGIAFTGIFVYEQRKLINGSITDRKSQVKDRIFDKRYRMELASMWNKAIDQTFEPAILYLISYKW
ncbi:unnamed protein product [Cochlearia groenlandica]